MNKHILMLILLGLNLITGTVLTFAKVQPKVLAQTVTVLSEREFSMDNRYHVKSVSDIFRDNILLNLAYLNGQVTTASDINWEEINQPFSFKFTLNPNETFAYHDQVLPEYQGKIAITTNTNFNKSDGYKTDGYLYGDGVCQLASLLSWAAKDANLAVKAPSNHDFAAIPEVPKSEGVAIYYDPNNPSKGARENLYITNNQDKPVDFNFIYQNGQLKVLVTVNS
jgi:VanW like protein